MCSTMNSRKRERDHNHLAVDLGLKEVHDSLGVLSEHWESLKYVRVRFIIPKPYS